MVLGLGPELFLAIYSSAGVFASVLSRLTALAGRRELLDIGSLGASHCVLAIFALSSCFYPQSRVQIVFLPFFSFSADSALKAMIAVETIALIASLRGIRVLPFDHAAHLGGLLFGLGFYHVGSHLWIRRNRFIRSITGEKR
jgi:rhomboid-like protein